MKGAPTLDIDKPRPEASRRLSAADPDPMKGGDIYKWGLEQAALIRAGRYAEIDWINVADEIESVGTSEFRSLKSLVEVIVAHMLKWDYQPVRRSRSWVKSIEESRDRVLENLSDDPSLERRTQEAIDVAFRLGRRAASRQTDLPLGTFPETGPYDWEAVMTRPFVFDQADRTA